MKAPTKRTAILGVFTSLILILSFIDSRLNVFSAIPGVRLGLANSVIVLALYLMGFKFSFLFTVLKVIMSIIFTTGLSGFVFTAFGSFASLFSMTFIKKILKNNISAIGVSVTGGFFHITVQYICYAVVFKSMHVIRLYPYSALLSLLTAFLIGVICNIILERVHKI